MNITFDNENPTNGASLQFSILRIGNYWIEGRFEPVTLRLKPTKDFWELFNFLRQRAIEKHKGPVSITLGGKDIMLEPSLWQGMIDRMFDWNDSLVSELVDLEFEMEAL